MASGSYKQVVVDVGERSFHRGMRGEELSAWGRGPHGSEGEAVDRGSPLQEGEEREGGCWRGHTAGQGWI